MTAETGETTAERPENEGWTTTEIAAKALRVTPRTIRNYVEQGTLEGRKVKRGRARPLEIEIGSLKRLRNQMMIEGAEIPAGGYEEADRAEGVSSALLEIVEDLKRATAEAAEYRTRLELTEQADSSLRKERDSLRAEVEQALESIGALRDERNELRDELEQERNRSWWRRLFQ